jgi:hypothetical protein
MTIALGAENLKPGAKPNVFVLHCGLNIKRVKRSCEELDLALKLVCFSREEVFSYYLRLDRPRPDLIVIRSHFRSLVNILNKQKHIPTIVVSTQQKPDSCSCPFIQAAQGYEGSDSFKAYAELAQAMHRELSSG